MISENSSYQFHGYAHTVALKEWTTLVIIQLNKRERERERAGGGGDIQQLIRLYPVHKLPLLRGKGEW